MAKKKRSQSKGASHRSLSPDALRARMERVLREIGRLDLGDMSTEEANAYLEEQLASGRFDEIKPQTPWSRLRD